MGTSLTTPSQLSTTTTRMIFSYVMMALIITIHGTSGAPRGCSHVQRDYDYNDDYSNDSSGDDYNNDEGNSSDYFFDFLADMGDAFAGGLQLGQDLGGLLFG